MSVLRTVIDTRSAEFTENKRAMLRLVEDLEAKLVVVGAGGAPNAKAKHVARGKLLPRDRVDLLLDVGTPFLELSPLAAHDMYGGDVPSASLITGVGRIAGRECLVIANDATIKGRPA